MLKKIPPAEKPGGSDTMSTPLDDVQNTIGTTGETSNPHRDIQRTLTNDEEILVNNNNISPQEEDSKYESEYVEATQLVEFVPETQIDPTLKAQVTTFLTESWANMADREKEDDNGVDIFPDKDFQLVFNKKRRNRKALTLSNTRPRSSLNKLSQ